MTPPSVRCAAFGAALVLTSALALTSCASSVHGSAATDEQISASCADKLTASTTGIDVSGSFQSETVKALAMEVVAAEVRRAAICGGHVRVFAFESSIGATTMLYDSDLRVDAPTENAQLRKAGKLADQTMSIISEQFDAALTGVTGNGSDPLGMLNLLAQTNGLYPEHILVNHLITDGVITVGIDSTSAPDADAARALADQQTVPSLTGADVSIVGIGRQGAGELSSVVIANLTAFWEQVCTNTGATVCHVSTEGR